MHCPEFREALKKNSHGLNVPFRDRLHTRNGTSPKRANNEYFRRAVYAFDGTAYAPLGVLESSALAASSFVKVSLALSK